MRFGNHAAILTTVITILTFGFAITAVPISGAYCLENCVEYPYLDTFSQFPKDFLWMPLAILLVLAYVTLMVSIHTCAPEQKKIYSQVGLAFALMAATILASDYFVQFSVIPVSLRNHETDGLAMLIQYNPNGVFIALEELGYLLMSLSFLFFAPVFAGRNRLENAIRWVFIGAFILTVLALGLVLIRYGLDKEYRFEVMVISIDWLVLIVNGILMSLWFRKQANVQS